MRFVLIGLGALVAASFLVFGMMMMAMGMGDHMRMMGGGVNPEEEPQVAGVTAIDIEDFAFGPPNVRVTAGTTVTWTNRDSVGHTVTSEDGDELDSELLGKGESYEHTFTQPGTYAYYCKPHPYMKGLVTVVPPDAA